MKGWPWRQRELTPRLFLAREVGDDGQHEDVHDLVNRDHEPEEVLDRIFARTLDGLDPPDDGPTPVEEHVRAEDEQEPAVVHWRQPDGRDKAQGVA